MRISLSLGCVGRSLKASLSPFSLLATSTSIHPSSQPWPQSTATVSNAKTARSSNVHVILLFQATRAHRSSPRSTAATTRSSNSSSQCARNWLATLDVRDSHRLWYRVWMAWMLMVLSLPCFVPTSSRWSRFGPVAYHHQLPELQSQTSQTRFIANLCAKGSTSPSWSSVSPQPLGSYRFNWYLDLLTHLYPQQANLG